MGSTQVTLDQLPVAALVVDRDGYVTGANDRCLALLATQRARLVGEHASCVFPRERELVGRLLEAAASIEPLRLHGRRRNGVPFSVDAEACVLPTGQLVCMLREVCGRRLLEESQRYFDVAFEYAPIGMALFNTNGQYIRVNATLCRMLGHSEEELLGRRDQEFTHPDDRQADLDAAQRILDGELDAWQTEKRFIAADGNEIWTIANLVFTRDDGGRPLAWVGQFQDITERKLHERRLRHLADHDELTGLANRRRLVAELSTCVLRAARYGERGAVLVLDLDGFKAINDGRGHHAGDAILVAVAAGLRRCLRASDVLGRLGGDEFAVILTHAGHTAAVTVGHKLVAAVREAGGDEVTASCGIALYDAAGPVSPERLLAEADAAMYRAKAAGRDTAYPAVARA